MSKLPEADVCLFIEGGYPYLLGGVSSWTHSYIRSYPDMTFHVVAMLATDQVLERKFKLADNVLGVTDVPLDRCPIGRAPRAKDNALIDEFARRCAGLLAGTDRAGFAAFMAEIERSGLGRRALLDSRRSWQAMERAYEALLPNAPMVEFFWTWRVMLRSVLSIFSAQVPPAKLYHAVSTGYAGLLGARAQFATKRPYAVTEHGIYTNERRIEICVADWLYQSGGSGFGVEDRALELRDLWLGGFSGMAGVAYDQADVITAQYLENQSFQRTDGAEEHKLRIIPNGIDVAQYDYIEPSTEPRKPTVALIGRLVPIKDVRTYILAASFLRRLVPGVEALIIGPEDEDPEYAAECRALVVSEGLQDTVKILGRVPDVKDYFTRIDVIALTSISEAQPLALLESGAAGLPAVTTNVGSCKEIINGIPADGVPGIGGYVVPACDPQAAALAMSKILLNPEMQKEMGRVMRARVKAYYSRGLVDDMYRNLYVSMHEEAKNKAAAPGALAKVSA